MATFFSCQTFGNISFLTFFVFVSIWTKKKDEKILFIYFRNKRFKFVTFKNLLLSSNFDKFFLESSFCIWISRGIPKSSYPSKSITSIQYDEIFRCQFFSNIPRIIFFHMQNVNNNIPGFLEIKKNFYRIHFLFIFPICSVNDDEPFGENESQMDQVCVCVWLFGNDQRHRILLTRFIYWQQQQSIKKKQPKLIELKRIKRQSKVMMMMIIIMTQYAFEIRHYEWMNERRKISHKYKYPLCVCVPYWISRNFSFQPKKNELNNNNKKIYASIIYRYF